MKKLFIFLLLLTVSAISFGQPITTTTSLVKADYMLKSEHQKTTGTILLVGGVTLVVAPFFIFPKISWGSNSNPLIIWTTTFFIGLISLTASIPFFINSSRYKKKGMRLSFKNETLPKIQKGIFVTNLFLP